MSNPNVSLHDKKGIIDYLVRKLDCTSTRHIGHPGANFSTESILYKDEKIEPKVWNDFIDKYLNSKEDAGKGKFHIKNFMNTADAKNFITKHFSMDKLRKIDLAGLFYPNKSRSASDGF